MKKLITVLVSLGLCACAAMGQSYDLRTYDAGGGPALVIKNDSTNDLTIVIAGTSGSMTNTLTYQSCDTVVTKTSVVAATNLNELGRAIATMTNTAGVAVSGVSYTLGGLSSDAASGVLLAGTYTSTGGTDNCEIPWDTSACLHYSILGKTDYQPIVLDTVFGNPSGTGDLTLSVYVDQALAWQNVIAEQTAWNVTNGALTVLSNVITLNEDVNLPIGKGKTFFIRAARATTATTGNIGYSCDPR